MIVGNSGERGDAFREGKRRKRRTIEGESPDKLGGDVLRVIGAAAVAEEQHFVALAERVDQGVRDPRKRGNQRGIRAKQFHRGNRRLDGVADARVELGSVAHWVSVYHAN